MGYNRVTCPCGRTGLHRGGMAGPFAARTLFQKDYAGNRLGLYPPILESLATRVEAFLEQLQNVKGQ